MTPTPDPPPTAPLTAEEIAAIRETYRESVIPPCRICGEPLTIGSMGGGEATRWGCNCLMDDPDEPNHLIMKPGRTFGDDHYSKSIYTDYRRGGDSRVIALLDSYAALRDRLARADARCGVLEARIARYAEKCAEIEHEYHAIEWHPDQCASIMFENRILEVGQMAIDDARTGGPAREGDMINIGDERQQIAGSAAPFWMSHADYRAVLDGMAALRDRLARAADWEMRQYDLRQLAETARLYVRDPCPSNLADLAGEVARYEEALLSTPTDGAARAGDAASDEGEIR